jgi:gamma-glutamyltranspeptidase/glutathione hydrolase
MVVSGSPYATEAGVRVLEAGGNAVDAAVAAAFGLAVAEPTQSGLGGRTQILVFLADGTVHGIDGTTQVPAVYDPETAPEGEHGHGAVGIPGTVAALARALDEHGSMSLATVLVPALAWARDGIALPAGEAARIAGVASELDPDSELARIFLGPDGAPPAAGATLIQSDLAGVLGALASQGPDAFYRGDIARRIVEDMAANGGFVTLQDLADYRAEDSPVGHGRFAGRDVWGSYLPASGVTVIEILQTLDRVAIEEADEARWTAAVVESLLAGFEDRELAEAAMEPQAAVEWLTSDSLADRRATQVARKLRAMAMAGLDPSRGVPALALDDGRESAFTTHVSVADTFGNVVALTQSLGPTMGARVVTPGLGFVYASTLGGYLTGGGPGYRPWSSQAPLVVTRDGRPELVIGGAGARRILSALVTTLSRSLQSGDDLADAMGAPRLHTTGGTVELQEGWSVAGEIGAFGYEVRERETSYFARLNAVEIGADGTFRGVAEPRWSESAAGGPRR